MKQALVRVGDGSTIVETVTVAAKGSERIKGLLGTDSLPEGAGLLIARAKQVHTFGMRYPLDVVFLDRDLKVLRMLGGVVPNRITRLVWGASWVLELRAGAAEGLEVGDRLKLVQSSDL